MVKIHGGIIGGWVGFIPETNAGSLVVDGSTQAHSSMMIAKVHQEVKTRRYCFGTAGCRHTLIADTDTTCLKHRWDQALARWIRRSIIWAEGITPKGKEEV